jgi:NAD+ synthetase
MKIASPPFYRLDDPSLIKLLAMYKKKRNFNAKKVATQKINILEKYCINWKIDTLIIPVSGGIDSAVVAALATDLSQKNLSSIKEVLLLFIPQLQKGSSNQTEAKKKVESLSSSLGSRLVTIDISALQQNMVSQLGTTSSWVKGQITTYLRTPVWYSVAAQLIEAGQRPLVLGTINFDEGGYIGFFSKSADAMTDVQMISDLHKSEVRQLASLYSIPEDILSAPPNGDMFDGRTDEEVFGTSYDFVELYSWYLQQSSAAQQKILRSFPDHTLSQFLSLKKGLDALHEHNSHKYTIPPQGLHFCIFPAKISGGWTLSRYV